MDGASRQPCDECGYDWDTPDHRSLIETIARAPRAFTALLTDHTLAALRIRPDPATWSPLEYTVHTGTALDFYADRIEAVLTADRPQLHAYDFAEACKQDRYNERSVEAALDLVTLSAERIEALLRPLTTDDWQRTGIGSAGDPRTVEALVRRAAHEVTHHELDVRRALD